MDRGQGMTQSLTPDNRPHTRDLLRWDKQRQPLIKSGGRKKQTEATGFVKGIVQIIEGYVTRSDSGDGGDGGW